jgi:hypothetical protein
LGFRDDEKIIVRVALAILLNVLGLRFLVLGKTFEKEIINSPRLQPRGLETRKNFCSHGFSHIVKCFGFTVFGFWKKHLKRK